MIPVEIAIDRELQQNISLIAWPAGIPWDYMSKAKFAEIKLIGIDVNRPNRIVLTDIVLKPLRQK